MVAYFVFYYKSFIKHLALEKMKKFLCVEFNVKGKKTSDIVCRQWMVDHDACYWPPSRVAKEDIERMVRAQSNPNKTWQQFKCKILCQAGK